GNGPLEEEMKRNTNDDRVIFLDFQNQKKMPVVYRLGNVFVMSSVSETWGLGINEAMACNRPVITNNKVGCAIDMVTNDKNGIIINSGDIHAAADYARKLMTRKSDAVAPLLDVYSFDTLVANISGLLNKIHRSIN